MKIVIKFKAVRRLMVYAVGLTYCTVPAGLARADRMMPQWAGCDAASGPAILVKVLGLKNRSGAIRFRLFGGSPSTYFDKKKKLRKVEFPVPQTGPVHYCMPVPASGTYAIDVRHDTNRNGKSDKSDGGGVSGNPKISYTDLILKRKPPARQVQVTIKSGVVTTNIVMNYLIGGSIRPVA